MTFYRCFDRLLDSLIINEFFKVYMNFTDTPHNNTVMEGKNVSMEITMYQLLGKWEKGI